MSLTNTSSRLVIIISTCMCCNWWYLFCIYPSGLMFTFSKSVPEIKYYRARAFLLKFWDKLRHLIACKHTLLDLNQPVPWKWKLKVKAGKESESWKLKLKAEVLRQALPSHCYWTIFWAVATPVPASLFHSILHSNQPVPLSGLNQMKVVKVCVNCVKWKRWWKKNFLVSIFKFNLTFLHITEILFWTHIWSMKWEC